MTQSVSQNYQTILFIRKTLSAQSSPNSRERIQTFWPRACLSTQSFTSLSLRKTKWQPRLSRYSTSPRVWHRRLQRTSNFLFYARGLCARARGQYCRPASFTCRCNEWQMNHRDDSEKSVTYSCNHRSGFCVDSLVRTWKLSYLKAIRWNVHFISVHSTKCLFDKGFVR